MPTEVIVDMWEMAHVKNAANLLDDLGFTSKEINLSKLSSIIDEELQDVHTEKELTPLLRVNIWKFEFWLSYVTDLILIYFSPLSLSF